MPATTVIQLPRKLVEDAGGIRPGELVAYRLTNPRQLVMVVEVRSEPRRVNDALLECDAVEVAATRAPDAHLEVEVERRRTPEELEPPEPSREVRGRVR